MLVETAFLISLQRMAFRQIRCRPRLFDALQVAPSPGFSRFADVSFFSPGTFAPLVVGDMAQRGEAGSTNDSNREAASSTPCAEESLRVHYLHVSEGSFSSDEGEQVSRVKENNNSPLVLVHCNHGFGASSLSFRSFLRPLARALALKCRRQSSLVSSPLLSPAAEPHEHLLSQASVVVLAHDRPGFGLTSKPLRRFRRHRLRNQRGSSDPLLSRQANGDTKDAKILSAAAADIPGEVIGSPYSNAANALLGNRLLQYHRKKYFEANLSEKSGYDASTEDGVAPCSSSSGVDDAGVLMTEENDHFEDGMEAMEDLVVFIGHSMGCLTSLDMALDDAQSSEKRSFMSAGNKNEESTATRVNFSDMSVNRPRLLILIAPAIIASNPKPYSKAATDDAAASDRTSTVKCSNNDTLSDIDPSSSSPSFVKDLESAESTAAANSAKQSSSTPSPLPALPLAPGRSHNRRPRFAAFPKFSVKACLDTTSGIGRLFSRLVAPPLRGLVATVVLPVSETLLPFLLRFLAYDKAFWRRGLSLSVWRSGGEKEERLSRLPSEKMLRAYRWPSLVRGWSKGLAAFTVSALDDALCGPPTTNTKIAPNSRATIVAAAAATAAESEEEEVSQFDNSLLGRELSDGGDFPSGNDDRGGVPSGIQSKLAALASHVRHGHLSVLVVHGDSDAIVPAANSRRLVAQIAALAGVALETETPRVGGNQVNSDNHSREDGGCGEKGSKVGRVVFCEFEKCGHLPHEEQPQKLVDLVARTVKLEMRRPFSSEGVA